MRCRPTSASKCGSSTGTTPERSTIPHAICRSWPVVGRPPDASSGARRLMTGPAACSNRLGLVERRDERQQIRQDRDALQAGRPGQLRQPGAHGQMGHQPCRAQPRRREPRMAVGHDERRRQRPGPVPGGRVATDQELVPGRRGQVRGPRPPTRPAPEPPGRPAPPPAP